MKPRNRAKYVILVGDGMADLPIESLGGKTPLEAARTPRMDMLAARGVLGLVRTVPEGMQPGSDIANLSLIGYDPRVCFSGRAPLEALNMGIELGPEDVAIRCNMVEVREGVMRDFSAGHISSEFSALVMRELAGALALPDIEFHPGVSYRNILVWRGYPHTGLPDATPPHDIHGAMVRDHLPRGEGSDLLRRIMADSAEIIASSPAIAEAAKRLKGSPTQVWLWGFGRRPAMETLESRYGLKGHTISAVDLIHGIGRAAGLSPIHVPGATGYLDTDYAGKAKALLGALPDADFILLHVEAPDESGHEGSLEHKLRAIEDFDEKIVGPVADGISEYPEYSLLVLPDHPTPVSLRTHTGDPVPFCLYTSAGWKGTAFEPMHASSFSEKCASLTGLFIPEGHRLVEFMLTKRL